MAMSAYVWEWMTDALLWRPFSPAHSQAIDTAFQAQLPSVDLCISSSSSSSSPAPPSHSISFQSLSPCQKNWGSGRTRPVRRHVEPQSGTVEWQWWEDESQQWQPYDASITLQIESAWGQCHSSSNSFFQASAPAGVSFRILHRKYTVEFEADAVQKNIYSQYSRKVRRRPVSGGTGPAASPSTSHPNVVSVPAPSVAAGAVSLAYNVSDLQPYLESSDDNDCPICVMNLREQNAVMLAKCRHVFCKECIMRWFETRPTCPVCTMAYGVITGNQPSGTMNVSIIPVGSPGFGSGLEGFPDSDIIQIQYNFPSGIQGPEHPSPGRRYTGTRRVAYLPSTKEGEDVLGLLKTAWDRRLLFSVGTSITTGQRDVVTWSGVHHKTNTWGGPSNFGYPDPTYFARVKAELAEKGVR